MIETKYFCDECGKEILNLNEVNRRYNKVYCASCADKIKKKEYEEKTHDVRPLTISWIDNGSIYGKGVRVCSGIYDFVVLGEPISMSVRPGENDNHNNGYYDWDDVHEYTQKNQVGRLPSKEEAMLMYIHFDQIKKLFKDYQYKLIDLGREFDGYKFNLLRKYIWTSSLMESPIYTKRYRGKVDPDEMPIPDLVYVFNLYDGEGRYVNRGTHCYDTILVANYMYD